MTTFIAGLIAVVCLVVPIVLADAGLNPLQDTFNLIRLYGIYFCCVILLSTGAGFIQGHLAKVLRILR